MPKSFNVVSDYTPAGDQPKAIESLIKGIRNGLAHQTLLGVTGSGKTFTIANVVSELQRPTIVMAHNKTLAAQLSGEFKEYFHGALKYTNDFKINFNNNIDYFKLNIF